MTTNESPSHFQKHITHTFLSRLFEFFMTIMVSVYFKFLKKMVKNGQFSLLTGLRDWQCSHRRFCSKINKEYKKVFFNVFWIYFSLMKKSTREKRESKKIFLKVNYMVMWKKIESATWHLLCPKVFRSSFINI